MRLEQAVKQAKKNRPQTIVALWFRVDNPDPRYLTSKKYALSKTESHLLACGIINNEDHKIQGPVEVKLFLFSQIGYY